jgi:hypothetical protein
MPVSLAFEAAHHYAEVPDGIEVPITLCMDVDSGRLQRFRTVVSAVVFFAQDSTFNRNFLGRSGWLDRLRIAIVDYDRLLFAIPYQS